MQKSGIKKTSKTFQIGQTTLQEVLLDLEGIKLENLLEALEGDEMESQIASSLLFP